MTSSDAAGNQAWRESFEPLPELSTRRVVANIIIDWNDGPRAGVLHFADPDELCAYESVAEKRNSDDCDWILAEAWPVSPNDAAMLQGEEAAVFCDFFFEESRSVIALRDEASSGGATSSLGSFRNRARLNRPDQPVMYIACDDSFQIRGAWRMRTPLALTHEIAGELLRDAIPESDAGA